MNKGKMRRDEKESKVNAVIVPTQGNNKLMTLLKCLIPGIPNEVTLKHISTKLPWTAFHTLSSVSRTWKQAIQDRLIHDARVRTHSTEAVVVVSYSPSDSTNAIALYSLRDKICYQLPPIPEVDSGIPWSCQCVTLNGKVYILGGRKEPMHKFGSNKVYVLDLAGQRQWELCASMQTTRYDFGCGVVDGKIYVLGGTTSHSMYRYAFVSQVCGSEVYDPNRNTWSAIKPMTSLRFDGWVATVREELWVYSTRQLTNHTNTLKSYHPLEDDWRTLSTALPDFGRICFNGVLFMAQGKLHSMSNSAIYAHNIETNSKRMLHSFSFSRMFWPGFLLWTNAVLAMDEEILAIVSWIDPDTHWTLKTSLVQSTGFGHKDKQIVWEKAECSLSSRHCSISSRHWRSDWDRDMRSPFFGDLHSLQL